MTFSSSVLLFVVSSLSPSLALTSHLLIMEPEKKKTSLGYRVEYSLSSRSLGAGSKSDVREDTALWVTESLPVNFPP